MFRVCVVVLQKFVFLSGESVNDFKARNFDALKGIWEEKY